MLPPEMPTFRDEQEPFRSEEGYHRPDWVVGGQRLSVNERVTDRLRYPSLSFSDKSFPGVHSSELSIRFLSYE